MSDALQNITILGATGSIGASTLDVIARHPHRYRVFAATANHRLDALLSICRQHQPRFAVVAADVEPRALADFRVALATASRATTLLIGREGLSQVAAHDDVHTVMAAIVGAAGLEPTIAAARAGKRLLLANKEAIVMGGALFMEAVAAGGAELLPIDSEHNAIFQCLPPAHAQRGVDAIGVRRILLTGSGGPFRTRALDTLDQVTPDEACAHPTWSMGRKISVDSATMMNKALEIIEAHWLFGAPADRIEVVLHPQSVIHSMVEYTDGSVLAQLGNPDMRTPIAHALAYPDRMHAGVSPLDLVATGQLTFERPDFNRFPALALAYEVLRAGGTAPAVFSAANEVAVAAFLDHRVPFPAITRIIARTLESLPTVTPSTLADVLDVDRRARLIATKLVDDHPVAVITPRPSAAIARR